MATKKLLAFILTFVVLGCGGGGGDSGGSTCGTLGAKIFGGDSCDQFARSAVVAIVAVGQQGEVVGPLGFCTGALVTLDDLITSAHCFVGPFIAAQQQGINLLGFGVKVGGQAGEVILISNLEIHPQYDGSVGSRYDVAMATLERVPSPPIGPIPVLISELTGPGSPITAFGYDTNQNNQIGELKAANFTVTDLIPGNLVVIGDGESSICAGDSGGPAVYVNSQGVATLAGVNSFTAGQCVPSAAQAFGFVDLQYVDIIDFIVSYAPDVAAG